MEFGLLGPLVVGDGESRVTVSAGKQRVVLAALLLRAGRVVPFAELAQAAWDGTPPLTARVTLQNYVKRLRQALGPAGHGRIVTSPAGYLIKVGAGELDLHRFAELAEAGRTAAAVGNWEEASRRLGAALALWRGDPLADVPSAVLAAEAPRLDGMRLDAVEARIDADLHLGRHREVVPELRLLVAAQPLRERPAELLMLALYRSGQQAEALSVYREARRHLVETVGIEPGPVLREMNQRVLKSDPGLLLQQARTPGADAAGGPGQPRPCMLPAAAGGFTGRSAELRALSAAMASRAARPAAITAISGTAGVGKTALAVHWARQHADRFPGGQLYMNLRGFGPGDPVPPAEALRGLLEPLQVPGAPVPAGLEALQALYRRLLAGRRALVVLDNARDTSQVLPLLPGTPDAAVLVTSRSELASLAVTDGARQLLLDVLTAAEARQMLSRRIGAARMAAEPAAADELIGLCARLPLALAITAARAAAHPSFPLTALAGELRDARTRLDVLSTGEEATNVRAVFSWSYADLDAPAARMFRLLGLHPGPDITAAAAASLAPQTAPEAGRLLRGLARRHLLAEPVPGRYALHDLLRAYAAEQAAAADDDTARHAAIGRVLDHYLHTSHAAALLLNSARASLTLPAPLPGVTAERLAGAAHALRWFEAEHHVLLHAVDLAAETGFDVHAWQLPWALAYFLDGCGRWHELAAIHRTALAAATRAGDRDGQAAARRNLALACARFDEYAAARSQLAECLGLYRQLGDRRGEAQVHKSLAWLAERQGRHQDALSHNRLALAMFQAIGHRAGQATALAGIGWSLAVAGDHERAREVCQQALALYGELGDRRGEAAASDSLGLAEHRLGRYAEAAACYRHALSISQELGDRVGAGDAFAHMGDNDEAAGNLDAARGAWRQALAIFDDLRHPDAAGVREKLSRLDRTRPGPQPGAAAEPPAVRTPARPRPPPGATA